VIISNTARANAVAQLITGAGQLLATVPTPQPEPESAPEPEPAP